MVCPACGNTVIIEAKPGEMRDSSNRKTVITGTVNGQKP